MTQHNMHCAPDITVQKVSCRLLEKVAALVENLEPTATACSNLRHISGTLKDIRDLQLNKQEDTATSVAVSLSSEVAQYAD